MKLKFKEDPKEWRKSTLLTLGGVAFMSTVLRWRHVIDQKTWLFVLGIAAVLAIFACLNPGWFRGYYRLSLRLGFFLSQFLGRVILTVFFLFIITPVGWVLRLAGKDPLQLKRQSDAQTYWQEARECSPLDRLF